jgi:hypothetical protein
MKNIFFGLLLLTSTTIIAQKSINNYKYIIVNDEFSFFNEADKYQTSSLMKFLFNKNGMKSFLNTDILPDDFNTNRCIALFAELKKKPGVFKTKVFFELKDCNRNLVYTSEVGESRAKDIEKSFHGAIRNTFTTIKRLNYSYVPMAKSLSNKKNVLNKPVIQVSNKKFTVKEVGDILMLYAQKITNGFQLVNAKLEKIFVVLNTKTSNIFIIKDKNGILYKNGNNWVAEFYENGNLIQKVYQIKF